MADSTLQHLAHQVVTHEKEFTHLRDALSRERRALPWEMVDKLTADRGSSGLASARR